MSVEPCPFKVGELVTRGQGDIFQVVRIVDYDLVEVRCLKAPEEPWITPGETDVCAPDQLMRAKSVVAEPMTSDPSDEVLYGNDVKSYVESRFEELLIELWPMARNHNREVGCRVEDHLRMLRTWRRENDETRTTLTNFMPLQGYSRRSIDAQLRRDIQILRDGASTI